MIFLLHLWSMIKEIAPFLILGFFICGVLSVFLSVDSITKYLGKKSFKSVFLASLFGVPIPLCSCGVIPVSAYLRSHGASKGATSSFLISTPQTGVDSIFITYGLLGPVLAIYRPIIAFISGVLGGTFVHLFDKDDAVFNESLCGDDCCNEKENSVLKRILNYGFVRLPIDIVNPLIIGLILSSMISILIPSNYFSMYGSGIVGMIIMLFLGLPTYVCATASVPIAFALYTKGFSLGAVLVFLMSGPATNITTISVTWKVLGKRSTFIYLATIVLTSMMAGFILDAFYPNYIINQTETNTEHFLSGNMHFWSGIFLILIMIYALWSKYFKTDSMAPAIDEKTLNVKGMTCSHCEESVIKKLLTINGVESVEANAKSGLVKFKSSIDSEKDIVKAIKGLGYEIIDEN